MLTSVMTAAQSQSVTERLRDHVRFNAEDFDDTLSFVALNYFVDQLMR